MSYLLIYIPCLGFNPIFVGIRRYWLG